MADFINAHFSEILNFVAGVISGLVAGSFITLKIVNTHKLGPQSRHITQKNIKAGGDVVGGDSTKF